MMTQLVVNFNAENPNFEVYHIAPFTKRYTFASMCFHVILKPIKTILLIYYYFFKR